MSALFKCCLKSCGYFSIGMFTFFFLLLTCICPLCIFNLFLYMLQFMLSVCHFSFYFLMLFLEFTVGLYEPKSISFFFRISSFDLCLKTLTQRSINAALNCATDFIFLKTYIWNHVCKNMSRMFLKKWKFKFTQSFLRIFQKNILSVLIWLKTYFLVSGSFSLSERVFN